MRPSRLKFALLLGLTSLPISAFAQDSGAAAPSKSAGGTYSWSTEVKDVDNGSKVWGTQPVLSQNASGGFIDARNGKPLTGTDLQQAQNAASGYNIPVTSVSIWSGSTSGATGINKLGFTNGQLGVQVGKSPVGTASANIQAGRVEWQGTASASASKGDVGVQARSMVRATLIGVAAEADSKMGDANLGYTADAQGHLTVGGTLKAAGRARVSKQGLVANVMGGAFAGAKADVQGTASAALCGISADATATAEANAGIGANGAAYFQLNWSTMTVAVGAKAGLTFGLGAGAGVQAEISLEQAIQNGVATELDCAVHHVMPALAAGIKDLPKLGSALASLFHHAATNSGTSASGSNVSRNANTSQLPGSAVAVAGSATTPARVGTFRH